MPKRVPEPGSRVLVVDDHPDTVTLFETCLALSGFRVTTATNARDALRHAANGVDAITTDLAMPGMDGGALIRQVRASRSKPIVPIVAVTGQAVDATTLTRSAIDCCRLLQKPVDVDQLADLLHFLIHACVHDCTKCPHRLEQIVVESRRS